MNRTDPGYSYKQLGAVCLCGCHSVCMLAAILSLEKWLIRLRCCWGGGIRDCGVIAQYNRECYTTVDNPENWPQNTAVCLLGMSALCDCHILHICRIFHGKLFWIFQGKVATSDR